MKHRIVQQQRIILLRVRLLLIIQLKAPQRCLQHRIVPQLLSRQVTVLQEARLLLTTQLAQLQLLTIQLVQRLQRLRLRVVPQQLIQLRILQIM